ncbi:MAG: LptE family protein [Vicingaceae bacterium]
MKNKFIPIILFLTTALLNWGCSASYSFTGASIPPEVETVSVGFFQANAALTPPRASQLFTEKLKDVFLTQTNLALVKSSGDLEFEGAITDYRTSPVAIQGNETAALTRVTMTVSVRFVNNYDETQNFETSFSRFEDFDNSRDLSSVEEEILQSINDQLTQDIFNKAVTNW